MAYIGITGITKVEEISALTKALTALDPKRTLPNHDLLLSFLMNTKTASGQPGRQPNRYVQIDQVPDFEVGEYAEGTELAIHYTSDEPQSLWLQMAGLWHAFNPTAIQLNLDWPEFSPKTMACIDGFPSELILQIGPHALDAVDWNPMGVAERLRPYHPLVTDVLIDGSAGTGKPLEVGFYLDCIRAIRLSGFRGGIGVAGGLDADTLDRITPIVREFPDISIDAESQLRTQDDRLDLDKAIAYLKAAHKLFASVR